MRVAGAWRLPFDGVERRAKFSHPLLQFIDALVQRGQHQQLFLALVIEDKSSYRADNAEPETPRKRLECKSQQYANYRTDPDHGITFPLGVRCAARQMLLFIF
jgi:hypothetical protein